MPTNTNTEQSKKSELREYRHLITSAGQASPPDLGKKASNLLKKHFSKSQKKRLSVIDVGCGLGHQMRLISESLPTLFSKIEGVDWSPATVEKHNKDCNSIYNKVTLCHSGKLPFIDNEFDIAISMENLEHLYANQSIFAIKEMARIAKYILITTPIPPDCINFSWVYPELVEAVNDAIPLTERDFICLESAVHKSTIFPPSMEKAGFSNEIEAHGIYFGESGKINIDLIECVGMEQDDITIYAKGKNSLDAVDFKDLYVKVLAKSARLHQTIVEHRLYTPPKLGLKLKQGIKSIPYAVYKRLAKTAKL